MKTKKLSKKSSLNNSIIASILFLAIFVLASLTMIAKSTCPFIEYRFDHRQIDGNTLLNVAKNAGNVYNGKINGTPSIVKGFGPAIDDKAMQFDDIDDYVEASGSKDIDFSQGVTVEAKICRRNNINEDAIVGKWYGNQDQWLLTFYADGNGKLIFTVRLSDGTYSSVEYMIPDSSYLNQWVTVRAIYNPKEGLCLCWNGSTVHKKATQGNIITGSQPIHIGDASNSWSCFDGKIDEVKIWNTPNYEF